MMSNSQMEQVRELARQQGILRPRDLAARGLHGGYLARLEREGRVEHVGRGLYRSLGVEVTEQHTLAEVCQQAPHGVVCLLSALRFHDLTTQSPAEVWLAIGIKARAPRAETLPLRIVRFSAAALAAGVEEHLVEGVRVRVYDPAKTVVDCFKYRNKIGLDVALEALAAGWRERRFTMDQLWRYAAICRMTNVMRPYLEALGGGGLPDVARLPRAPRAGLPQARGRGREVRGDGNPGHGQQPHEGLLRPLDAGAALGFRRRNPVPDVTRDLQPAADTPAGRYSAGVNVDLRRGRGQADAVDGVPAQEPAGTGRNRADRSCRYAQGVPVASSASCSRRCRVSAQLVSWRSVAEEVRNYTRCAGLNSDGNTMVIGCPNAYAVEWLELRLKRQVRATEQSQVEVLGQSSQILEYRNDVDPRLRWRQDDAGLDHLDL